VLVPQEVDELFANLQHLVAEGVTILFISHKLDEVLAISDEITVIRDGSTVATVLPADVDKRHLGELMVGEPLTGTAEVRFRSQRNPGSTHLTVEVELHRWQGGRRTTLLGFEAGLELRHAAPAAA